LPQTFQLQKTAGLSVHAAAQTRNEFSDQPELICRREGLDAFSGVLVWRTGHGNCLNPILPPAFSGFSPFLQGNAHPSALAIEGRTEDREEDDAWERLRR
jgi:hypothetical protein